MNPLPRRADWIWRARQLRKVAFRDSRPPDSAERNRYIFFRKTFELGSPVERADVRVSADGRYRLFVNGKEVGFGPARSSPDWLCADPYDLAPHLRPGRNLLAALVHSYGRNTSWYELPRGPASRIFGCGGFWLEGDALSPSGVAIRLDTDSSWRYREARGWDRKAPGGSLGYLEIYDARKDPADWAQPNFDDSGWKAAAVLRVPGFLFSGDVVPFPALFLREIPALSTGVLRPQATAPSGEVKDSERTTYKLFDFGRIVFGTPKVELEARDGASVELTYGDELDPDGRVCPVPGIPGFDVPPRHRYAARAGAQTWELFEPAGFRYLEAAFRGTAGPLTVRSIEVVERRYPVSPAGRFRCSDVLLTRIWEAAASTLALCMQDSYVDCPSREQRQWVADASLESMVNYAVFGDAALAARFLRQVAQAQHADGRTPMCAPGDFAAADFLSIPDFTLHWILAVDRHNLYMGDAGLARELFPSVRRAIAWFERWLGPNGLLVDVPGWIFLDWAEHDKIGQVTALNALFAAALSAAARLARTSDAGKEAEQLDRLAQNVAAALNERLWDEGRGVYADARRGETLGRRVSQLANAALIAHGIAPPGRWPRILAAILDPARVTRTRRRPSETPMSFDEEGGVIEAQPFGAHVLHRALAAGGRHGALLDHIRSYWGPMLDFGSTFWETWEVTGWDSRCHGYSSSPAFELSTEILGVSPISSGFERFRISPHPAGLDWAQGDFPTPRGPISVSWKATAGKAFELAVTVPQGSQAQVVLPEAHRKGATSVEVDGSRADAADLPKLAAGKHHMSALR